MIPIIVNGVAGRMGQAIMECALHEPDFQVVGALEHPDHPSIRRPLHEIMPGAPSDVSVASAMEEVKVDCAVMIDFTTPEATVRHLEGTDATCLTCSYHLFWVGNEQPAQVSVTGEPVGCVKWTG